MHTAPTRQRVAIAACALGMLTCVPAASQAPAASAPEAAPPASQVASQAPGQFPQSIPLQRADPERHEPNPWLTPVLILALAAGGAGWVLRRRGTASLVQAWKTARTEGHVQRLSSQTLTRQTTVHVLRWQGEDILIACTPQKVTLLGRKTAARPTSEPT